MNEYWNQFSYSPFCYVWDPIEEIHVISNMVSELQWSSPPLPPPPSPSYERFLRPARRGFKRCRRSTTARLSSFTFSDLIADFGDNTTYSSSPSLFSDSVMSSGSCSSFSDSMVMVSDSLMVQESFVKVEDEDSILHPPVPPSPACFDVAMDETISEKILDHFPVSFFADREIKIPAWKPAIDPFVFGTFSKGFFGSSLLLDSSSSPDSSSSYSRSSFSDSAMVETVPEKILEASSSSISVVEEAIASDSASTTDPAVSSSFVSHLSFFANRDIQFPAWKPATNAYVFGDFSEGAINLGADSCLMKNSIIEVIQILLSIKESQLSWLGLWNFSFDWKNDSNLLLEIDGSWFCTPSVCGNYSEIVNLPTKLSFDPGGFWDCSQVVCEKSSEIGNLQFDLDGSLCCSKGVCENNTMIGDSFESILLDPGGFRSCTQGVCVNAPIIDRCSLSSLDQVQFMLIDKRIGGASNLNIYQDAMVFVCCNHCSEALEFSDKLYMLACEVINRLTFTLELSESAYALIYAAISDFEILHKTNMLGLSNGSLVGIATICVFQALSSLTLLNASATIVIENNEDDPIDQATVWNSNTALQLLWHTLSNSISLAEMQLSQSSFCFNIKTYFVMYFGTLFGSGFNGGCSTSKSLSACSCRDFCDSELEAENAEFLSWLSEAKVSEQLGFSAHERLNMLQNLVKSSELGASQGLEMGLKLSKVLIVLALLHILCFYFLLFLEAPPVHVKMQQAH